MATPGKWSNVAVAMQSAIGADKTVTAITKASPGVVTSTAHGLTAGNIVLLTINGMFQLNGRVARVANVTTNTFELEGIDTTLFDAFTSGTCALVTLGTSITTVTSISSSGGGFESIDTTTIHTNQKTSMPGPTEAIEYTTDHIWAPDDPGQAAMKAAYDAQATRVFSFTFGTGGRKMYFAGTVGASLVPGGQAQGLITTQAVIKMSGAPTFYAS